MEQTVTTEVETATRYCPNGCGDLRSLGGCFCCGYIGCGVGQFETDHDIDADEETGKYVRISRVDAEIESCSDCGQELADGECLNCVAYVDMEDDPREDDGVSQDQQDYCNLLDEIHTLQACLENEREAYSDLAEDLASLMAEHNKLQAKWNRVRLAVKASGAFLAGVALAFVLAIIYTRIWG